MKDFEEARQATEEMFADEQPIPEEEAMPTEEPVEVPAEEIPVEEVPAEEVPQEQPTQDNTMLDDAVNTAETAAQFAQEQSMQLQQALQELEALKAQNQQMQGMITELSQKNEEHLIEEAMQPPVLDINGLAFADEDTIRKAQEEHAQKSYEYYRQQIMNELAPTLEYANKGMREAEKTAALSALSEVPELSGINEMLPQLERIISNNKWLQSDDMSTEEKYINAYAIARGVNAINTPPEEPKTLTDDDLMKLYDENPTFQELIEKKRIASLKDSQQVPPFSASSGAVNAALNIKEKPKTFEEASERTRRMFGLE